MRLNSNPCQLPIRNIRMLTCLQGCLINIVGLPYYAPNLSIDITYMHVDLIYMKLDRLLLVQRPRGFDFLSWPYIVYFQTNQHKLQPRPRLSLFRTKQSNLHVLEIVLKTVCLNLSSGMAWDHVYSCL